MADRAVVLAGLERELRAAVDVREDAYAVRLRREIARLSAGSRADPLRETAGARRRPAKSGG